MKKKLIMLAVVVLSGSLFAGCGKSETSCPDGQILENGACKACPAGQKPNASKTACEIDLCGNGKLDSGEKCDKTIPAGKTGACPIDCDKKNVGKSACSPYKLENAGTCQAECVQKTITEAVDGDRCCPEGKTPDEDKDCTTPIGVACKQDGDCDQDAGLKCVPQGAGEKAPKDGFCRKEEPCSSDEDCPGGEALVGCFIAKGSDGKKQETGTCLPKCKKDVDCRSGYICGSSGFCLDTENWCDKDTDCNGGKGQRCKKDELKEGERPYCVPYANGSGAPGTECESVADCGGLERGLCLTQGKKKGFCTLLCAKGQESDPKRGCGAGTLDYCYAPSSGPGLCLRSCTNDAACSETGFSPSLSKCSEKALTGVSEHVCSLPSLEVKTIGNECSGNTDCGSGAECLTAEPYFHKGGYCSADCGPDVEAFCPQGSVCIPLSSSGQGKVFRRCLQSCEKDSDCSRAGYGCLIQQIGDGPKIGFCVVK